MYMAVDYIRGRPRYTIRESYYDARERCMRSRDLVALGLDPSRSLVYPSPHTFYIDESVVERVASVSSDFDLGELEDLFWPFVRGDVREHMAPFHSRGLRHRIDEKTKRAAEHKNRLHIFDKRRLSYLRFGTVDRRRIGRLPAKYFQRLRGKSRDEIEQYLLRLEHGLRASELKRYVYVTFDLQRHFPTPLAATMPYALNQYELDAYFIADLCGLHEDKRFWAGMDRGSDRLHGYLIRYVIMFFDYQFGQSATWEDFLRDFMDQHRAYRPPPGRSTTMNRDEALEVFGLTPEEFSSMRKKEITKRFREKAHEAHPDKGGDHDAFVQLVEAYHTLLKHKG
jgi:hypothetical protein